jgi:hypothetical protein
MALLSADGVVGREDNHGRQEWADLGAPRKTMLNEFAGLNTTRMRHRDKRQAKNALMINFH